MGALQAEKEESQVSESTTFGSPQSEKLLAADLADWRARRAKNPKLAALRAAAITDPSKGAAYRAALNALAARSSRLRATAEEPAPRVRHQGPQPHQTRSRT